MTADLPADDLEKLAKVVPDLPFAEAADGACPSCGTDPAAVENVVAEIRDAAAQAARAEALTEAADDWPVGVCAHRCFRTDEHVAPKDCLYGPDWLRVRAAKATS